MWVCECGGQGVKFSPEVVVLSFFSSCLLVVFVGPCSVLNVMALDGMWLFAECLYISSVWDCTRNW